MKLVRPIGERGFTLIELLVVAVLIVIGSLFSLYILSPETHDQEKARAERRAELAYIAQSINRYVADKGTLPADFPEQPTAIGTYEDHYDLCQHLVPKYMKDMPADPSGGIKTAAAGAQSQRCDDKAVKLASGYAVLKEKDGRVTLSAPFAEAEGEPAVSMTFMPPRK